MREIKFRVWDVERKSWMNEQDVIAKVPALDITVSIGA
jgi:hypothetical protein